MQRICLVFLFTLLASCASQSDKEAETILVGGATGRQGSAVVDELLSRGYRVRAITRKPDSSKAEALRARGVEVVQGDYGDKASMLAAMQGIERMFFYSGFSRNEVAEGNNVISAAQESGLQLLVYSSGAAADPTNGIPGSAKMEVELAITGSGIPYTVLRPVAFMENFDRQQKRFKQNGIVDSRDPDRMLHFISIPDIGFFAGEVFDNPQDWTNRDENIASDKMTVAEMVATFSRVSGTEIAYVQMPLEDFLATMPKPLRPLFRWYEEVGYEADVGKFRAEYPELITLEKYLQATGWDQ
ncbi:MAG: NmrA/HSCARG family protein [Gammaproteobacteria bacterium]